MGKEKELKVVGKAGPEQAPAVYTMNIVWTDTGKKDQSGKPIYRVEFRTDPQKDRLGIFLMLRDSFNALCQEYGV